MILIKDKILRDIFFGRNAHLGEVDQRVSRFTFPKADENDKERRIFYRSDDGLILYLIKRIETLEEQIRVNKGSIIIPPINSNNIKIL